MPFKSDKQKKWMFANKPEMAKKWMKDNGSKTINKKKLQAARVKALS